MRRRGRGLRGFGGRDSGLDASEQLAIERVALASDVCHRWDTCANNANRYLADTEARSTTRVYIGVFVSYVHILTSIPVQVASLVWWRRMRKYILNAAQMHALYMSETAEVLWFVGYYVHCAGEENQHHADFPFARHGQAPDSYYRDEQDEHVNQQTNTRCYDGDWHDLFQPVGCRLLVPWHAFWWG